MRFNKMVYLLTFTTLFCFQFLEFESSSSKATQFTFNWGVVTPRDEFTSMHPFWYSTVKRDTELISNETRTEWLIYCLIDSLESKPNWMSDTEFNECVEQLCKNLSTFEYSNWKSDELIANKQKLAAKLTSTLAGQRYLRFPRFSRQKDGSIKLRFPFPEVYGLESDSLILREGDQGYSRYFRSIKDRELKDNEELVELCDFRHGGLDWDTTYAHIRKKSSWNK